MFFEASGDQHRRGNILSPSDSQSVNVRGLMLLTSGLCPSRGTIRYRDRQLHL
jgi:hypothetical protein